MMYVSEFVFIERNVIDLKPRLVHYYSFIAGLMLKEPAKCVSRSFCSMVLYRVGSGEVVGGGARQLCQLDAHSPEFDVSYLH